MEFGFCNKTQNSITDFNFEKSFLKVRNPYPECMDFLSFRFIGKSEKGFAKLFSLNYACACETAVKCS